jgi:hypothetical protein
MLCSALDSKNLRTVPHPMFMGTPSVDPKEIANVAEQLAESPESDKKRADPVVSESRLKDRIWLQFRRKTGTHEHEQILSPERESLIFAIVTAGQNCVFTDRITRYAVPAAIVGHSAARAICEIWTARPQSNRDALALTNAMACYVWSRYDVRNAHSSQERNVSRASG